MPANHTDIARGLPAECPVLAQCATRNPGCHGATPVTRHQQGMPEALRVTGARHHPIPGQRLRFSGAIRCDLALMLLVCRLDLPGAEFSIHGRDLTMKVEA